MIHSFLLIGKSNMAGRGFLNEALPVDFSHVRVLRNGLWTGAFRPLNPDRGFSGANLAESFAEAYAAAHAVEVGIIPCADGGTCMDQWMPGEILYDNAVFQAKLAMRTSRLAGILWHQGESDMAPERWPQYEEKFRTFVQALRRELGAEDVPFLVGGLGDFLEHCPLIPPQNCPNYAKVNGALARVAATEPQMEFVSAAGLGANPDQLHFNAAALHAFGLRYYAAQEKLPQAFAGGNTEQNERTALENL